MEGWSGSQVNTSRAISMGDSVTLSGSTELDNGMTVSMSFELDDADTTHSYDSHSITISSDALGTLTFSGNGGSSAVSAMDATAAGDIFDNFDGQTLNASAVAETSTSTGNAAMLTSPGGDDSLFYTAPSVVDGLAITASYNGEAGAESSSAFGLAFTGVEGLTVSYGQGSKDGQAAGSGGTSANADATSIKASYAMGSFTVAYSDHDYDSNTSTSDQDATSWKVSYTVSDAISLTYGSEEIDSAGTSDTSDAEYTKLTASYTAGGMTISANMQDAENISYTTATDEDIEYVGLSVSFAF
jgi:outer membrane protein OmpU